LNLNFKKYGISCNKPGIVYRLWAFIDACPMEAIVMENDKARII